MPIHDWTRVDHGTFHNFHVSWSVVLNDTLNETVLPADYYSLVEQHAGGGQPDVIALQAGDTNGTSADPTADAGTGLSSVAVAPPVVRHRETAADDYSATRKTITIRQKTGGRVVAFIEVMSPGNKSSRHRLREFVDKPSIAIGRGLHVLVIDLFPPGPRDPAGIHPLIWASFGTSTYASHPDQPLTLASYSAGATPEAFVESVAVADELPAMPLFLRPGEYVLAPLEASYQSTWFRFPRQLKGLLEP